MSRDAFTRALGSDAVRVDGHLLDGNSLLDGDLGQARTAAWDMTSVGPLSSNAAAPNAPQGAAIVTTGDFMLASNQVTAAQAPLAGHHFHTDDTPDSSDVIVVFPANLGTVWSNDEVGFATDSLADATSADIYPGTSGSDYGYSTYFSSYAEDFTTLGNHVVFVANNGTDGRELWITDGTAAGTSEVKNINPSGDAFFQASSVVPMLTIGDETYFAANDGTHGYELWKTDGTSAGTTMVKDLNTGGNGYPSGFADLNGKLVFSATDGTLVSTGFEGNQPVQELWISDGTSAGTSILYTPTAAVSNSYAPNAFGAVVSGDHVFFIVDDGSSSGNEQIYVSDGTVAGTHILDPDVTSVSQSNLTDLDGTLYFGMNDGTHGNQLWKSDGTAAGTTMVTDVAGSGGVSVYSPAETENGNVYFVGSDGTHGLQVWKVDGSADGASMVKDIPLPPGLGAAVWSNLAVVGNELYFVVDTNDGAGHATGYYLWQSDGTDAGTIQVSAAAGAYNPQHLQVIEGVLYFTALGADSHNDLFKFDGTTFTEIAENYSGLNVGSNPGDYAFIDNTPQIAGAADAFSTTEATAIDGNLFADNGHGADTGSSLSVAKVNGTALAVGVQATLPSGALIEVNSDGTFTYDPNGAFDSLPSASSGASNLTATDSFTYTLTGASSDTTVTITLSGLDGNDLVMGSAGVDTLSPGTGEDTVRALASNDVIQMGANLDSGDKIDGGAGTDVVVLNGDYSAGVVFNATTLTHVEAMLLTAGHSYNLTSNDGTVLAGGKFTVDGSSLGAGDSLTFDGGAETDGYFVLRGGAGADVLTGGSQNDTINGNGGNDRIDLSHGGNDTATGDAGDDTFVMGAELTTSDKIDGGSGNDTLELNGDYSAGLKFGAAVVTGVETIKLDAGFSYNLTTQDAVVPNGGTLTVDGTALGLSDGLTFNGSYETDGSFDLKGGAGGDVLRGGLGSDILQGGLSTDQLTGGGGSDTFLYTSVAESTGGNRDWVKDFDFSNDLFQLPVTVTGIDSEVTGATLSRASFNTDLAAAVGSGQLAAGHAVLVAATGGDLATHLFLVVDANGTAGYQGSHDFVFDITGATNLGSIGTSDFVT